MPDTTDTTRPAAVRSGRRRVILLSLDWHRPNDPRLPLGHASLLASLKAASEVEVVSICHALNGPAFSVDRVVCDVLSAAKGLPPERVDLAIGAYVWNERELRRVLSTLRSRGFSGRIIGGGPQISYADDGLEELYPEINVFIRGYGEQALAYVTKDVEEVAFPGLHFAGREDSRTRAEVELGALPSPHLTGVLPLRPGQAFLRWETQRGCPYRCSFCQHREAGARLARRTLSAERLGEEISLFAKAGVRKIAVLDPIFNLGDHAIWALEEFKRRSFEGELWVQCRFESLSEAFLDACQQLKVNLEFGLQTIHEREGRAVQRLNRIDRVVSAIESLHRRGMNFEVSLIYGLPEQTLQSFQQTVDFCRRHKVPVVKAFPLMLLRGTPLERDRERWRLVENDDPIPAVIASSTFDERDWREMRRIAQAL